MFLVIVLILKTFVHISGGPSTVYKQHSATAQIINGHDVLWCQHSWYCI